MTMREEFDAFMGEIENFSTRAERLSCPPKEAEAIWQAAYAAGQRAERQQRQEAVLMGECMEMVHADLIEYGVIDKAVPPMMVPEAVALAMRAAVIREREACAQIADDMDYSPDGALAAAIRNRKEQG